MNPRAFTSLPMRGTAPARSSSQGRGNPLPAARVTASARGQLPGGSILIPARAFIRRLQPDA